MHFSGAFAWHAPLQGNAGTRLFVAIGYLRADVRLRADEPLDGVESSI